MEAIEPVGHRRSLADGYLARNVLEPDEVCRRVAHDAVDFIRRKQLLVPNEERHRAGPRPGRSAPQALDGMQSWRGARLDQNDEAQAPCGERSDFLGPVGDAQPAGRLGGHGQAFGDDAGGAVCPIPVPAAQGVIAPIEGIVDRERMIGARSVAGSGIVADEAYDPLTPAPCLDRRLPGLEERVLRRFLVFEAATGAAERFARQRRVGQAHFQDAVIGRPVLEPFWRVRDDLVPDAPVAHPGADDVEIGVCFRFLVPGVGCQHEVGSCPAGMQLEKQRSAVHADAVSEDHRRPRDGHCHDDSSGSR